jgi:hypothetical protein
MQNEQGCQRVYLHTKIPILVYFFKAFELKISVYFITIKVLGVFNGHLAHVLVIR